MRYNLIASVGFMFDTSLAVARMIFDGFFDRYPNLKLIASHGGGALPYIAGRLDICFDNMPACRERISSRPSTYLKKIYYDSVVFQQESLELALKVGGDAQRPLRLRLSAQHRRHEGLPGARRRIAAGAARRGARRQRDADFQAVAALAAALATVSRRAGRRRLPRWLARGAGSVARPARPLHHAVRRDHRRRLVRRRRPGDPAAVVRMARGAAAVRRAALADPISRGRSADRVLAYAVSSLLIAGLGGAMQSARRRTEESEQRFRAFMQNSPSGVFLKDEEGRYLFVNRAGEQLIGRGDWLGKTDGELVAGPGAAARSAATIARCWTQSSPRLYDLRLPTPQGERTLSSVKFSLSDASGRRYVGSITTRRDRAARGARRRCARPTAARTSSSPRWRTSCATRSRRSAPGWRSSGARARPKPTAPGAAR